jgi:very-short-patch-repair endonuclease
MGKIHDYNKENDIERDMIMSLLGLNVLRFKNEEIENSSSKVIKKIGSYILELENELTHHKSLS